MAKIFYIVVLLSFIISCANHTSHNKEEVPVKEHSQKSWSDSIEARRYSFEILKNKSEVILDSLVKIQKKSKAGNKGLDSMIKAESEKYSFYLQGVGENTFSH